MLILSRYEGDTVKVGDTIIHLHKCKGRVKLGFEGPDHVLLGERVDKQADTKNSAKEVQPDTSSG